VVRDSRPKHFFQNIYDLCNSIMFLFKDNSSPKIKTFFEQNFFSNFLE
jgi:hypothetical protein